MRDSLIRLYKKLEKNFLIITGFNRDRLARIWDQEYTEDRWTYLRGSGEVARYGILAASLLHFKPRARVLDVGCGEGLLLNYLQPESFNSYLGIDISGPALSKPAGGPHPESTRFEEANAEQFTPPHNLDVVIFNEVVYYFTHPKATLERYRQHLSPEGLFIVSMYHSPRNSRLWEKISPGYQVLDSYRLSNAQGISWRIQIMQPEGRASASAPGGK